MFLTFDGHFKRDLFSVDAFELSPGTMAKIYPPLRIFFARYGGQSFNNGIYRVIGPSTLDDAADFVSVAFLSFASGQDALLMTGWDEYLRWMRRDRVTVSHKC
jgi:hypothetical protein